MAINEATFEAQLGDLLGKLFPGGHARIAHQVQFSLRLGHHDIAIDGRKGLVRKGRLDILLSVDAKPAAVLELKQPDLDLTSADRDQGLSYARLLQPMPPLVIVSNGRTTQFFTTIDGSAWEPQSLTEDVFATLVASATSCAAHDRDQAIRSLLGSDPTIWGSYLRAYTTRALKSRTGDLHDFSYPFAREFSVERLVGLRLLGLLRKGASVVALVGPPLSGKSVVLRQCCEKMATGNLVPLYVDASSARQGPLQLLASIFLKHLFSATTSDQVRQWLSTSLRTMAADTRLVLLLDDVVPDFSDAWQSDLDELLGFAETSPLSIVLALDPNTWHALRTRPGRSTRTELGRRAEVLNLELLDDKEFSDAMNLLFKVARSVPYFGAQYNIEYREPRVLRVIAATVQRHDTGQQRAVLKIPSTTTVQEVELAWGAFVRGNHELLDDLRDLARAYFEDLTTRRSKAELQLASYRAAAMPKDIAVKLMAPAALDRLLKRSYLSTRLGPNEEVLILPRHLELFARAAALELGEAVCAAASLETAYAMLMQRSDMLPLGDIVGADALRVVSDRNPELFSRIVAKALTDQPETDELPAGTVLEFSLFGKPLGSIELPEPSAITGNLHPWLVLAQLAMFPLAGPPDRATPNAWIIANVGSYPGFLRRVSDERWRQIDGFHFHSAPGKGSVPCMSNGVVEPIGQAIITAFHCRPEEMLSMANYAVEEDRFHLAWRLYAAAREVTSATEPRVAAAADEALVLIDDYIRVQYKQILHEVAESGIHQKSIKAPKPQVNRSVRRADTAHVDAARRERNKRKKEQQQGKRARQKARQK